MSARARQEAKERGRATPPTRRHPFWLWHNLGVLLVEAYPRTCIVARVGATTRRGRRRRRP